MKVTHELAAIHFPDVRREGFEEIDQTVLRLPQHVKHWVRDRFAGQCPVEHEALWGMPRKHVPGDLPDKFIYLEEMVHSRRGLGLRWMFLVRWICADQTEATSGDGPWAVAATLRRHLVVDVYMGTRTNRNAHGWNP